MVTAMGATKSAQTLLDQAMITYEEEHAHA